ncbi:MAG: Rrf2 family transcriptional regulator [Oscillospiraceae bacterium]|nr:Rrf2 family transcriptional regulator [Oscillospiraceae bacterium]
MMISSRGRYALRVMIDLAGCEGHTPLKDIAARQELSLKYLEQILPILSRNNLVTSVHGKGGGYRLNRMPEKYKVGEILRLAEGDLIPVSCMSGEDLSRFADSEHGTMKMWTDFYNLTNEYFDSITIADLMNKGTSNDYVI